MHIRYMYKIWNLKKTKLVDSSIIYKVVLFTKK